MTNWRLGNFLNFTQSQDQQKTFRRRLITFKVTLTGQSHFMLIFWLRKVILRGHINSVKWPLTGRRVCPPPSFGSGGGDTLSCDWGGGGSQFGGLEKKPSTLSTLCCVQKTIKSPKWILLYCIQCTQNARGHINSVKALYAVTPTPYIELTQLV